MRKFKLSEILKEDGQWSLTRWITFVSLIAFFIVTAYLVIKDINWSGYDTFASLTGGGGTASQLVNKFINGKYNTPIGQVGKPTTK